LKRIEGVQRVAFCFSGSDIPHAHAHLVPLHASTDITSRRYIVEDRITFRPTPRAPDEELAAVAARRTRRRWRSSIRGRRPGRPRCWMPPRSIP
jgi:diadenosine tetraphosphate (Ap4A) HIT family hydrolase